MKKNSRLIINENISIQLTELNFRFSRSGGRGGQNVNKVETRVELLFNIYDSNSFSDEEKNLLTNRLKNKIDKDGNLRIVSQKERTQGRNKELAVERFVKTIQKGLFRRRKRISTKNPESVNEDRIKLKKLQSHKKELRKKVTITD